MKYENIPSGGGVSGNLKPDFIKTMKLFLAGQNGRSWCIEQYWKMFLAGQAPWKEEGLYEDVFSRSSIYILESFFYADEWIEKHIPLFKDFLLDSGAFTFFSSGKAQNIDWNNYVDRLANFINRNKVKHFFELDIDKLVGYNKVLDLRKRLEDKTGLQCIPVWHKSRGKDNYFELLENYKYIAIGGIVSKEISKTEYPVFSYLLQEAHKRNVKVHGLGFTNLIGLTKYHFDSVDSTSWTSGNRFGSIYKFNGKTMIKFDKKEGQRLADSKKVALNNFCE